MNRRKFIKAGALFVPAFPAIIKAQTLNGVEAGVFNDNPAASGSSCTTLTDSRTGAVADVNLGDQSFDVYIGAQFTAGSTYTACKAQQNLKKTASPAGNIRIGIFNDSAGTPGATQIGGWSDNVSSTTLTTSYAIYVFLFSGAQPSLTSGTVYWFVTGYSTSNASNFCSASLANFSAGHTYIGSDTAGAPSGWSSQNSFNLNMGLYK